MFKLAWSGVRHNPARYVATLVAILTGVAFFTASGFLADRVIDAVEGDVERQYGAVDVAISIDAESTEAATEAVEELRIPVDVAEEIAGLDGVAAVAGTLIGQVAFLGDDGAAVADGATGRLWVTDDELNPVSVIEGEAPTEVGEVAVDRGLAEDEDLAVGDEVVVLTLAGDQPASIVGITEFGESDAQDDGGTISIPDTAAFDWLNSGHAEYDELYLRTEGSPAEVIEEVTAITPDGFVVQRGEELRTDKKEEVGGFGRILKQALQFFSLLAMFVGGFVIYNTFSVIVTQRLCELAVLSALGATPKQLKRSLRYEGLVLALLGSALGVVTGVALAFGLDAVLGLLGVSLPGGGIVIGAGNIIGGILLGTIITVVSVTIPARRAARTEPIEALRDAAVESTRPTRARIIAAVALLGLGLLATLAAANAALIGIGVFLVVLGVIISGPMISLASARVLHPLMARMGIEGELAIDNTARNPKRTATTANALLIGVFLVTLGTVAGNGAKKFAVAQIHELEGADYRVESQGGTIDDDLVADFEAIDGVELVLPFRREAVTIDGEPSLVSSADVEQLTAVAGIDATAGSLDDLTDGTIALLDIDEAGSTSGFASAALGDTVTVTDNTRQDVDLEVVALVKPSIDALQVGALMPPEEFEAIVGDTAPTVAFMDTISGAQEDVGDQIDEVAALRPDVSVAQGNLLANLIGGIFDFLINAVNGLLMMSVIIALIGIVNTLSLSILERRRELGLLRVIGMTDRRVRKMVRLESIVVALNGTVSGVVLGLFAAFSLTFAIDRLTDADLGFELPFLQLLAVILAGVVLGFLASLIPAQRSTRMDLLDALDST